LYLARFRKEQRGANFLEVLAGVYGKEDWGADTAVCLDVVREEVVGGNDRFPWLFGLSPARETMAALRLVGLLGEVIETKEGLVVWPAGMDAQRA